MLRFVRTVSICALMLPAGLSPGLSRAGDKALQARAEVNWRYGSERSILMSEFWVPFVQDEDSVIYGDLRLMGDDQDNREGNLGIGYRRIDNFAGYKGVVGVHGWFDRRLTDRGSQFHQITLGGEWLGEDFDILANAYVPLSSGEYHSAPNADPQEAQLIGTGIVIDTDATVLEEPQHGFDIELGWNLPFLKDHTDSFRLYGGGYAFDSDHTEGLAGWRTRLSADLNPDVSLGARFQRDDVRGSQGFLEATIRFPFGAKKSYRREGLRARLDESPERDIDIVSAETVTDPGDRVAVLNQATGSAQEVLHVDNTAAGGGDGSAEAPFNSLAAAQAAAAAHTVIYIHTGDGSTTGQDAGITLNDEGQQLIGAGTDFTFDGARFSTENGSAPSATLLVPADTAPVITGAGNGVTVTADKIVVAGITVDGAGTDGIRVLNNGGTVWDSVDVHNVTLDNNSRHGMRFDTDGAGSTITNLSAQNITASNNTQYGVYVRADNSGQISSATLGTVTANSNHSGVFVYTANSGQIHTTTLDNVTTNSNTNRGIFIDSISTIDISVLDSSTKDNGSTGLQVNIRSGAEAAVNILNHFSDNDSVRSVYIFSNNASTVNASINNLVIKNNKNGLGRGLQIQANLNSEIHANIVKSRFQNNNEGIMGFSFNDGDTTLQISDSTLQGNVNRGIYFITQGNGTLSASIESNLITSNSSGIRIDDNSTGSITSDLGGGALGSSGGNSIHGNSSTELRVDLDGGELKAENNWWGASTGLPGGEVTLIDSSTIDTDPYLTSAP